MSRVLNHFQSNRAFHLVRKFLVWFLMVSKKVRENHCSYIDGDCSFQFYVSQLCYIVRDIFNSIGIFFR